MDNKMSKSIKKNQKFNQKQIPASQLKNIKGGSGGSGAVILTPIVLL